MIFLCITTFVESILTGIVANIIFSVILIWFVQKLRYYYFLKRKFHNKQFDVSWKMFPNEIIQKVTCKVSSNIIKYKETDSNNNDPFEGEFIINPINLRMGEGFHTHTESDGFGFSKIIIRDEIFYVESPYTNLELNKSGNKEGKRIYQAFIWKLTK